MITRLAIENFRGLQEIVLEDLRRNTIMRTIEHYAGTFPLWLAPEQVRVLTIGDDEALVSYAKGIVRELRAISDPLAASRSSASFQ